MTTLARWIKRLLLSAVLVFLFYQVAILDYLLWWNHVNLTSTRFMEIRLTELRRVQPNAELAHTWVPYAHISRHLKAAVIAAEDAKFVDHEGFDWEGIQRAMEKDQKKGKIVAGGSTISQQLAKNLFLTPTRSFVRKGEEAIITVMMETVMPKQRIFEIYLNVIEWGNGVFGAEAAARHYFGVSAAQLSPEQAAKLAAMVPNPRYYDLHRSAPGLQKKTAIILSRMPAASIP